MPAMPPFKVMGLARRAARTAEAGPDQPLRPFLFWRRRFYQRAAGPSMNGCIAWRPFPVSIRRSWRGACPN